jgi:hypothetical protein
VSFEVVEPGRPHEPIRLQPRVDLPERFGSKAVEPPLSVGPHLDESGFTQDAQVLGDGRLAEVQVRDERTHGLLIIAEELEDALPMWFGQDVER